LIMRAHLNVQKNYLKKCYMAHRKLYFPAKNAEKLLKKIILEKYQMTEFDDHLMSKKEDKDIDKRSYLLGYADGRDQSNSNVKETCHHKNISYGRINKWFIIDCSDCGKKLRIDDWDTQLKTLSEFKLSCECGKTMNLKEKESN